MLNEDLLQEIIAPVSFQAKKKDWLKGLPEKVLHDTPLRARGRCRRSTTTRWRRTFSPSSRASACRFDAASPSGRRSSQIQCGFVLNEWEVDRDCRPEKNPRLKPLREILDEEVIGKVVIVYRHRLVGQLLQRSRGAQ